MMDLRVLIVGGGIGGMSAAIRLRERGFGVELIDLDPDWRVYGAGMTITGPTLRAYRRLGLIDELKAEGSVTGGARVFRFDGTFLNDLDEPPIEDGLPATAGILRPVLHRIMQRRIQALEIPVRLGVTVDQLEQDESGVTATFSDGAGGRYDLVVGADSIASKVRALAFPWAKAPEPTGQGCWRITLPRPPGLSCNEFYLGHRNPAGISICGPDACYMWVLTADPDQGWVDEAEAHDRLREEIADFGGNVAWIRENMTRDDYVNYRPLAAILQPAPWVNGRIALLGDAAHATTPHLASGAGMAVESALVLVEELEHPGRSVETALRAYHDRRYPRCRHVVETSIAAGRLQLAGGSAEEVAKLIGAGVQKLAEEY